MSAHYLRCAHCGREASMTIRATVYAIGDPRPVDMRETRLCDRCFSDAGLFFRGWRTTFEPPFLYGRTNSAARCSTPACRREATHALRLETLPAYDVASVSHEVYACDKCLEMLYAPLFGTFWEGDPWTS